MPLMDDRRGRYAWTLLLVLLSAPLSGCILGETPPRSVGDGTGDAGSGSDATSGEPSGGDPHQDGDARDAADYAIAFAEDPRTTAAPFDTITISWRIDGPQTTASHTALHADLDAQPLTNGLTASDYAQAYYPGQGPYTVPGTFTVSVTLPASGSLHLRPHALVGGAAYWGDEVRVDVLPESGTGIALLSYPSAAQAGVPTPITWHVQAPDGTRIPHTAIHYGPDPVDVSRSSVTVRDYPHATRFHEGPVPADFVDAITPHAPGFIHFRGHAVIDGVHYWTDEVTLPVHAPESPNVVLTDLPATVAPGATFTVAWRVNAPDSTVTSETAVHYAPRPVHGDAGTVTSADYPAVTEVRDGEVPGRFEATVTVPEDADAVHLRAHVVIDGASYWSDARRVPVTAR